MSELELAARESMFVLDGGDEAHLPDGSGGPVLAGPEAVFVAGRVAADAPTHLRIGRDRDHAELVLAYRGVLATPSRRLRVVNVMGDELGEVEVAGNSTEIEIFLSDLDEPDEIYVALVEPDGGTV